MKKHNDLVLIQHNDGEELNKQQKNFNRLTQRVVKLKELFEKDRIKLDELSTYYAENVVPLHTEFRKQQLELAVFLDAAHDQWKFTKKQSEDFKFVILELFDRAFELLSPDEVQEAIYNRWSDISYAEEIEAYENDMMNDFSEMFSSMFGVDIDMNELKDNPEAFETIQQKIMEKEEQQSFSEKPKSKKQLEREEKEKFAEAQLKKNIRSIYLSLAKVLHPDTSTDEAERIEKEDLMKEVTLAYEKKDLPTLLLLESRWLSGVTENIEKLSGEKLSFYIKALQEQVKQLETDRFRQKYDPRFQDIFEYKDLTIKSGKKAMDQEMLRISSHIFSITSEFEELTEEKSKSNVLAYVKDLKEVFQYDAMGFSFDF